MYCRCVQEETSRSEIPEAEEDVNQFIVAHGPSSFSSSPLSHITSSL